MSVFTRVCILYFVVSTTAIHAQSLKPGFDADEYIGVLQRCTRQVDASYRGKLPKDVNYTRVYRSPAQGLHNKYDVWLNKEKTIITINLRGTTSDMDSWLENFYSAMIPATGTLQLTKNYTFHYKFANDPKALVHTGWTTGIGAMAPDIVDKLQYWYAQGVKQVIIEGHSQGGALAYLLTSYLYYLKADGGLPADLVMKTYCSAAPKPGNLYYAYDYEHITAGGWGLGVVNAADWVPETPFAVQTVRDMNNINPFVHGKEYLKKQKLPVRLYGRHVYNRLTKGTNKSQRRYTRYLGKKMYKQVKKYMPEFVEPEYAKSFNYVRAGSPVILMPDAAYYQKFPDTGSNVFRHHLFEPYYYLVNKNYK